MVEGSRRGVHSAAMDDGFGIAWRVSFRSDASAQYLIRQAGTVVDRLAKTPLWAELQVQGAPGRPAQPLGKVAELKKLLRNNESVFLARGDRDALLDRDGTDVRLSIETMENGLALTAIVRGEPLARIGVAAIDAYADVLADLAISWRGQARLSEAWAQPVRRSPPFSYPRVRPPRVTRPFREPSAIVDVLDTKLADSPMYPDTASGTRALARAELPAGVDRRERDGIVILRWLDDPCDAVAAAEAAARHEQWLYEVLPTSTAPGWNVEGDLRLTGTVRPSPPSLDLVTCKSGEPDAYFGHVTALDRIGEVGIRTLPDGAELAELRLLAPSRAAALELVHQARAAGFDRVVHRDASGTLWDPAPPGTWLGGQ